MNREVGQRLRELRKKMGYSQNDFANIMGISRSFLSEVESGKSGITTDPLTKLMIGLNININWLLTGDGEIFIEEDASNSEELKAEDEIEKAILKRIKENPSFKNLVYSLTKAGVSKDEFIRAMEEKLNMTPREAQMAALFFYDADA